MLLAIDIGNTSITLGAYRKDKLLFTERILTDKEEFSAGYALKLEGFFENNGVSSADFSGAIISSVVPEVTTEVAIAVNITICKKPLIVGERYNGNLKVNILPVSYLGADLIAASVGAIAKYPLPCLVADLGTATKILVIDKDGVFRGCTISPGVKISLAALADKTSLLPEISLSKPKRVIGENTVECMQSGIVYGTAAMLDGLIKRIKAELGEDGVTVVATGGYSKTVSECCETEMIYDENLLLDGLRVIYDIGNAALLTPLQ